MRKIIYLLPLAAFFICCPVAQGKTIYVANVEHITLPKGTWGNQNKKIAKINGKKELIGKKKGKTVVKNNKKEITVVVKKAKEIRLAVGDYKEIGKGKWNSTQIAAVKNKKLIAKKAGKTYIKNKKGKCYKVIVEAPRLSKTTAVTNDPITLKLSGTKQKIKWNLSNINDFSIKVKSWNKVTIEPISMSGYTTVTATVGHTDYTCRIYTGNVIPYTTTVCQNTTQNVISSEFASSHNLDFSTEDPSIAEIDTHGNIIGKKPGLTTVNVTINGTVKKGSICVIAPGVKYSLSGSSVKKPVYFEIKSLEEAKPYIPTMLYQAFNELGFQFKSKTKEEMYDRLGKDGYGGYFSITDREIGMYNKDCISVLHEFGHFLNHLKGYVSNTDAFKKIYEKEKDGFLEDYPKTAPNEYFAESYAYYRLAPYQFQITHPETYTFIKEMEDSLSEDDIKELWYKYDHLWE